MCGDPDAEDGNIDACNDESSAPFELSDGAFMLGDDCDSVDDDLHEQLNLEDPKEEDEEKHRNAGYVSWTGPCSIGRYDGIADDLR